ncbi:hypothetical protein [Novosphingobium sp.]|uniref:hypothetical protein n=1 Tax=Novosphingobium sp. TaxID=1874826 RepID=UPI003BAAD120
MSILDKAIAAITPPESEDDRLAARAKAENMVEPGDWLFQILDHHREIEAQFCEQYHQQYDRYLSGTIN